MDKKLRNLEEVQRDYVQLCTKAGDLQYKISVFSSDLKKVNEQLQELNFEAVAIQEADAKAKAAAKAVEEAKAVEAPKGE